MRAGGASFNINLTLIYHNNMCCNPGGFWQSLWIVYFQLLLLRRDSTNNNTLYFERNFLREGSWCKLRNKHSCLINIHLNRHPPLKTYISENIIEGKTKAPKSMWRTKKKNHEQLLFGDKTMTIITAYCFHAFTYFAIEKRRSLVHWLIV